MTDIKDKLKNAPYFDDYSEDKDFYQILFRPRFAVQARELTQLQTIFQKQIDRMGRHFFKEGAMVIPGLSSYDTNYTYVKIYVNGGGYDNSNYFKDDLAIKSTFIGGMLYSSTGVNAKIVNYTSPDNNGIVRLYIKYTSAGDPSTGGIPGTLKTFLSGEVLHLNNPEMLETGIKLKVIEDQSCIGVGTGANINSGVYFTNGYFAAVKQQSIVIAPEETFPTASIGLLVETSIVTPEEDESLLDNAQGSPNYAAPGAHRLKIDLTLISKEIDRITTKKLTSNNFIELIRLIDGIPQTPPSDRTDYNLIRDEMARRTFDESGNYSLKPFIVVCNEFLNEGGGKGIYTRDMLKRKSSTVAREVGKDLLGLDSSHPYNGEFLPGASEQEFLAACRDRVVYDIDPGKAYVNGYEIEKLSLSRIVGRKAVDYESSNLEVCSGPKGPYVLVNNVEGLPAIAWGNSQFASTNESFAKMLLFSRRKAFMNSTNVPISPAKVSTEYDVRVASTANITSLSGLLTIDGVSLVAGDRVLVKNQTDPSKNGIYVVVNPGSWTRISDMAVDQTVTNKSIYVKVGPDGTVNKNKNFILNSKDSTSKSIVGSLKIGTSSLQFEENTEIGTPQKDFESLYCIGTARPIFFSYDSQDETGGAKYSLHLMDIQMKDGYTFDNVQSIYQSSVGSGPTSTGTFFCDAVLFEDPLIGTTVSTTATFIDKAVTGKKSYWRTDPSQQLSKNDCLVHTPDVDPESGLPPGESTYFYVLNSPLTNASFSAEKSKNVALTDVSISKAYSELENQHLSNLFAVLPKGYIKSIDQTELLYETQMLFVLAPTDDKITISLNRGIFTSYNSTEWFFCSKGTGEKLTPAQNGVTITTTSSGNGQAVIEFYETTPGDSIVCIVPVAIEGDIAGGPRIKTLKLGSYQNSSLGSNFKIAGSVTNTDLSKVMLDKEDVIKIKAIYMAADFSTDPTSLDLDISDRYELDNGQRDMFYDIASISLKKGAQPPTGKIAVVFDSYEHGSEGTYFCVESYIREGGAAVSIFDIPKYESSDAGFIYSLRDVLDFRSTKDADGTFKGKISYIPNRTIYLKFDYYLHRKDKLYINNAGEFKIKEGIPAFQSVLPDDPLDGMVIAELILPALTEDAKGIFVSPRENRRYTMRDIGKIEKRIERLEYYTSLSLLEKDTASLVTKDANGDDRFKHGFLVDNFKTHAVGDVNNSDYVCCVDPNLGNLRPAFVERSVLLSEIKPYQNNISGFDKNITEVDRVGYIKKKNLLMLPYESQVTISQRLASSSINVNPYNMIFHTGKMTMTPDNDVFKTTNQLESAIVKLDTGLADALSDLTKGLGTVYDNFQQTDWVTTEGQPETMKFPPIQVPAFNGKGKPNELMKWQQKLAAKNKKLQNLYRTRAELLGQVGNNKNDKGLKDTNKDIKSLEKEILSLERNPPQATWPAARFNYTRTTSTSDLTARGKRFSTTTEESKTSLGSSVKNVTVAEYCRSQIIHVSAKGLKPNSAMYAFFDGLDVTHLCIPKSAGSEIVMPIPERDTPTLYKVRDVEDTNTKKKYPAMKGTGTSTTVYFNPNTETGNDANAAGAYPLKADQKGNLELYFFLPNGIETSLHSSSGSTKFTADQYNPKIRTGSRTFKLSDSRQDISSEESSRASKKFESSGIIQDLQEKILSTQNVEVSVEYDEQATIYTAVNSSINLGKAYFRDPIAETFVINSPGGCFISGVTLYFRYTPRYKKNTAIPSSGGIPVVLDIRETGLGVPGPRVIPGSRVSLDPDEIVINEVEFSSVTEGKQDGGEGILTVKVPIKDENGDVIADKTIEQQVFQSNGNKQLIWDPKLQKMLTINANNRFQEFGDVDQLSASNVNSFVGTYFEFDYPVYIQDGTSFAIVITALSDEYEVWYATNNQYIAGTASDIVKGTESYAGEFLKSSNSATWSVVEASDLMFQIHQAKFDIEQRPLITFANEQIPFDLLPKNPFKVEAGSSIIKVRHKNHGMRNRLNDIKKPRVKIMGVTSNVGGIDSKYINTESEDSVNKYHEVVVLDFDSYAIDVGVDATTTSYSTGGDLILVTADIQVDEMKFGINDIILEGTGVDYSYRICSGSGVHGDSTNEPYVLPLEEEFELCQKNSVIKFQSPKLICGRANEGEWTIDSTFNGIMNTPGVEDNPTLSKVGASKSLFVQATLLSQNENLTPIIDVERVTCNIIGNKVSDPGLVGPETLSNPNTYKSFTEPTDYVFFGFKLDSTVTLGASNQITVADKNNFHVGGYVLIQSETVKNLRKVVSVSTIGNTITVDKNWSINSGESVQCYSSALDVWNFADEAYPVASNVSITATGNSFTINNSGAIAALAEIPKQSLIKLTSPNKTPIITRVVDSIISLPDLKITVEDGVSLSTLTPTDVTIYLYEDIVTCTGFGSTGNASYDVARSVGKSVLANMKPGQYIKVMNSGTGKNDSTYEISRIEELLDDPISKQYKLQIEVKFDVQTDLSPTNITVLGIEDFFSGETAIGATSPCNYITKRVILKNPSTALKVNFLGCIQDGQSVTVYAKLSGPDDPRTFDDIPYIEMNPLNLKLPTAASDDVTFSYYEYEERLLPQFTAFAIKLVLSGNNSSKPVKVKDLQVIALDE